MTTTSLEPHNEFYLAPYKQGVKTFTPECKNNAMYSTRIQDLFDLKLSVYFLDTESIIQNVNLIGAMANSFGSAQEAMGHSAASVFRRSSSQFLLQSDLAVLNTQRKHSFEKNVSLLSGLSTVCVDYKFPWYDYEGKLQGIFGVALFTGGIFAGSLIDSLASISKVNHLLYNLRVQHSQPSAPSH